MLGKDPLDYPTRRRESPATTGCPSSGAMGSHSSARFSVPLAIRSTVPGRSPEQFTTGLFSAGDP